MAKLVKENPSKYSKDSIVPFAKIEHGKSLSVSEQLNSFIQNNRRIIGACIISICVLLAGFIAFLSIRDFLHSKAISQVEELNRRYELIKKDPDTSSRETETSTFMKELSSFASKHSGYAGARGYSILAGIYAEEKDWEAAEKAWIAGAKAGSKTYLVPVFLFNAAVAKEEQGNIQGAIDLYAQSVSLKALFPAAARAQFQIGRLEEERNNREAAIQAYRELLAKGSYNTVWANLAQSRIISLTTVQ